MSVILPLPAPPRDVHSPFRSRPTTPVSGTVSPTPHSPRSAHASHSPAPGSPSLAAQVAQRMSRPCTPPPHAGAYSTPPGSSHGGLSAGAGGGGGGHSVAAAVILGAPVQPISAPPTPVTPTHTFSADSSPMERCRSSEAGCGVTMSTSRSGSRSASRERRREPTESSLLLHTYPSRSSTPSPATPSALGPGRDKEADPIGDIGSHLELPDVIATPPTPSRLLQLYPKDDHSMDVDMDMEIDAAPDMGPGVDADGDVIMDLKEDVGTGGIAPVPTEEAVRHKQEMQEEQAPQVWGMSRWGMEGEEIKPGVRILDLEQLPEVIQEHNMLDVPSHILFPWLHGINDDGQKGRVMAAFFGHQPPFEPPSYRGLTIILAPDHPLNSKPFEIGKGAGEATPLVADAVTSAVEGSATAVPAEPSSQSQSQPLYTMTPRSMSSATTAPGPHKARARSETMSTSSGSYASYTSGASTDTEATSLSVADYQLRSPSAQHSPENEDITEEDVQMHPCESKKAGTSAPTAIVPEMATRPERQSQGDDEDDGEWSDNEADDDGQERAACVLQNSSYCLEIFWIPELISDLPTNDPTIFRQIRLPNQINLRNLNIQPIKYATLSDIVLYAKGGISAGVVRVAEQMVQAQNAVYEERMAAWYADAHLRGVTKQGEGLDRPVRYGVWIIKEPFEEIQRACPQLVQLDSKGRRSTRYGRPYALFEREIYEAAAMTRACEVAPNFWVGNDMDVPGKEGDGAWWHHRFDLCILASEMNDMPTENDYHVCKRTMREIEKETRQQEEAKLQQEKRQAEEREKGQAEGLSGSGMASPATVALRNILSGPSTATTSKTAKKDASQPIRTFDNIDISSGSGKRGPSDSRDDLASIPASKNPRFAGKAQTQAELDAAVYPYASLMCAGSSRNIFGQIRSQAVMMDKLCVLMQMIRAVAEGRADFLEQKGVGKKVLVHCHDGYTESTILVLGYIMFALEMTLPEAFLHLQVTSQRSFFLYPVDKPLLKRLDLRLQQDRRNRAMREGLHALAEDAYTYKLDGKVTLAQHKEREAKEAEKEKEKEKEKDKGRASPASPPSSSGSTSRWKSWSFRSSSSNSDKDKDKDDKSERRTRKESSSSLASTSSSLSTAATAGSGQSTPTGTPAAARRWSRESRESRPKVTAAEMAERERLEKIQEQERLEKENQVDPKVEEMKVWFMDRRFEGFPSRILPFLYLGNIEHAGNAGMLKAVGITHVVSVGESLLTSQPDHDPMYGLIGSNTLGNEARKGTIQVLDLADIRDDGNDPLRPLIARACKWIEEARKEGGTVLVHCRVGVSRSASIVIAYMMQHQKLGLIDAYLTCRARRLNVLIQPNLRFFHELFGWEVELAREEEAIIKQRRQEMEATGMVDEEALKQLEEGKRRIVYAWPTFCRDLHFLNRRFLCN